MLCVAIHFKDLATESHTIYIYWFLSNPQLQNDHTFGRTEKKRNQNETINLAITASTMTRDEESDDEMKQSERKE